MQKLFNEIVNQNNSQQNVYYEARNKKSEITQYINENLAQMQSLDYCIEDHFDALEFSAVLEENLPNHADNGSKNSFMQDIQMISELFFNLTHSKKIKIKLEVVTTDKCRFFHVDHIKQRLLCTYNGPGTEWLDNTNVNRNALGKGKNFKVVKDFSKVRKANMFDLLLLRGERFHEDCRGAVHRSPSIKSSQVSRVILKIDEL